MNEHAHDLAKRLDGILGTLPGASAVSFQTFHFTKWRYILISAASEAAVHTLAHHLGLEAPVARVVNDIWWYRAVADSLHGDLRIAIVGPHEKGPPPPGTDAGAMWS